MNAAATLLMSLILWLAPAPDGWLGVFLATVETPQVAEVVPGSPADKAGIKADDRFLAVDDHAVTTRDAFVDAIRACKQGQRVKLKLQRNGAEMVVVVQLGERPQDNAMPEPKGSVPAAAVEPSEPAEPEAEIAQPRAFVGVGLESAEGGLRVNRVIEGSPAAAAGIEVGDVLVKWGDAAVADFEAVERQLQRSKPGDKVALQLRGEHGVKSVMLQLGRPAGAAKVAAPRRNPAEPADAALDDARVFGTDLAAAQATGKPVLVLFGAAWNGAAMAQRRAFEDPSVRELLGVCECVFLDTDRQGKLAEAHGVQELPQLEWLVDGKATAKQVGYLPPPELAQWLRARTEAKAAAAPTGTAPDVAKELREIRTELRELRQLLEQMRRE